MAQYTTTQAPLPWMEPYLQDYMGRAQDVANQPYQQGPGTYTGPNSMLTGGWQATANRAQQGSPVMGAASGQLQNTLSGGQSATMNPYADTANPYASMDNPYLSQSIQNAQGDLTSSWNNVQRPAWEKAMSGSGSFGNSGVAEYASMDANNLQKNLGRIGTDMRGAAYNQAAGFAENQANRRFGAGQQFAGSQDNIYGQAMGLALPFANQDYTDIAHLTQAGQQAQGFDQAAQGQQQDWWNQARQFPQQQLDAYGRALGVGTGGTSTQQVPDASQASQLLGGGLTGAALYQMLFGGK